MNWDTLLLLLVFQNTARAKHDLFVNKVINVMERRHLREGVIFDNPRVPDQLPESEPVLPGHTLIQPETGSLKSSMKFPQDGTGNAVYGNMDQLSITYAKTPDRILYTGFRKANSLLDSLIYQAIRNIQKYNGYDRNTDVVVIASRSLPEKSSKDPLLLHTNNLGFGGQDENAAIELLDESTSDEDSLRRTNGRRGKYRNRNGSSKDSSSSSSSTSSTSSSSDNDKNDGNPFTLHKGKYQQNFLWNHLMDGDHMNVNPYGPKFDMPGPSGVDLFFGRKWWYFNQDDFKPLGRK